jgi:murein peptide amidase A
MRTLPTIFRAAAVLAPVVAMGCGDGSGEAGVHRAQLAVRAQAASNHAAPTTAPLTRRRLLLGYSVEHRPIVAHEIANGDARVRLLVVGCIHGNEPAGIAVARRLDAMAVPPGVELWVVDDLNPDGAATDTRQNADRVDLNRNFPYRWHSSVQPGDQQYPGPRPLSEPESRIAYRLVIRLRPQVAIYFHQPLGLVDESGGDPRIERRFAALSGLPLRRLMRYPGSAVGWQDHRLPASTAFVVELGPGTLTPPGANRMAQAVLALARGR